jgi:hypothetical protein
MGCFSTGVEAVNLHRPTQGLNWAAIHPGHSSHHVSGLPLV